MHILLSKIIVMWQAKGYLCPFPHRFIMFCIPSKHWPHGRKLKADLREQGCAVWDSKLHTVQGCPIEVLLQTPCYHIMWECLHMYSSACRAIYLFATFSNASHLREYRSESKTMTVFKVGIWLRQRKVAWSGEQSLTWHYLQEEPTISSNPLKREWEGRCCLDKVLWEVSQ